MKIAAYDRPAFNPVSTGVAPAASIVPPPPPGSSFEAWKVRTGPVLTVIQPPLIVLSPEQRAQLEQRLRALEATAADVDKALARADAGQPFFGALREALQGLPEKLKYEIEHTKRLLDGVPTTSIEMTPFVKQEIETLRDQLDQLDWYTLDRDDHGLAEDLAYELRASIGQPPYN